jgi:hypothetical protein
VGGPARCFLINRERLLHILRFVFALLLALHAVTNHPTMTLRNVIRQ